jgi:hypothetical protein
MLQSTVLQFHAYTPISYSNKNNDFGFYLLFTYEILCYLLYFFILSSVT